jgi:hypothetical protein
MPKDAPAKSRQKRDDRMLASLQFFVIGRKMNRF